MTTEQQIVFRLLAPRATLRLRFPIADLRPERDPWAGRAVRAEQLRLELSEPQFRSELSSGPGPPAPARLELICSDLHGKSTWQTMLGRGPMPLGKVGLGVTVGVDPGTDPYQLCGHQHQPSLASWATGRVGPLSVGCCSHECLI